MSMAKKVLKYFEGSSTDMEKEILDRVRNRARTPEGIRKHLPIGALKKGKFLVRDVPVYKEIRVYSQSKYILVTILYSKDHIQLSSTLEGKDVGKQFMELAKLVKEILSWW